MIYIFTLSVYTSSYLIERQFEYLWASFVEYFMNINWRHFVKSRSFFIRSHTRVQSRGNGKVHSVTSDDVNVTLNNKTRIIIMLQIINALPFIAFHYDSFIVNNENNEKSKEINVEIHIHPINLHLFSHEWNVMNGWMSSRRMEVSIRYKIARKLWHS